jgi:Na+-driven multidrug efflux pump
LREIYSVGLPAAAENLAWQAAAVILSRVVLLYGSAAFAAYQLGLQTEMFLDLPCAGFAVASAALASRAIGARDGELLRAYHRGLLRLILGISAFVAAALFLFPHVFLRILTDKPEIQALGATYVFMMGFAQPLQSFTRICNGFMRASGGKRAPMVVSFIGLWGLRVPLAILIGLIWHLDIRFLWSIIAVDHFCRALLNFIYMRKHHVLHSVEGLPSQPA